MKRILFLLLLTVSVYGQNPSRFAKIQITGNANSGTATKVNVQEANGEVNTQTINTGFNKNIGLGGSDIVGATTLLNQYSNTPTDWTAQTYTLGSVVFYGGKQWIAKIATVAGDVPSVSSKWEEITFETLANKTVIVDAIPTDGSNNAVSSNGVFDALATKAPISSVHNPVTIGTANGLSLSTQQLSLGLASSGVTGALSGTDWNVFNGKFNTPSGLTTNYLPKWNGSSFVNSKIFDNNIGISFGGSAFFGGYEFLTPAFGNNTIYIGTPDGTQNPRAYISHQTASNQPQKVVLGSAFSAGQATASWYLENGRFVVGSLDDNGEDKLQVNGTITASPAVSPNQVVVKSQLDAVGGLKSNLSGGNSFTGNQTITGDVTATTLIKSGGTSSQFLKANGSVDSNTYLTSASLPTVDQTIIDGSTNAVSGNAVFDGLAGKADISQLHNPVTIGNANGLSLSTQQLSLGLASSTTTGALSGTDWNTFNGKFNTPTGLTTNYLPKWNGSGFGNSNWQEIGGRLTNGSDNGEDKLQVNGSGSFNGNIKIGNPQVSNQKLNVEGSLVSIDNKLQYLRMGMEGDIAVITTDWFSGAGGNARPMEFKTGGVTRFIIDQAGNIIANNNITASPAVSPNQVPILSQVATSTGNQTIAGTKTFSSPVIIPNGVNANEGVNKGQLDAVATAGRPYKVYSALYSQNGTSNPTVIILENTLGTVTFSRLSTGVYSVDSSGLFTTDKTFVTIGAGINANYTNAISLINSSTFSIITKVSSTQADADSANTKVAFEIRVYN